MGGGSSNSIIGHMLGMGAATGGVSLFGSGKKLYDDKKEEKQQKANDNQNAMALMAYSLEKKALQDAADKKLRESEAKNATTQYQKPPIYTEPNVNQKNLLGV